MKVTIGDLITNLQQFSPDWEVRLDKDGWLEEEIKPKDVQDLINQRGLWGCCFSDNFLIINN
jgi:hypothetical protein